MATFIQKIFLPKNKRQILNTIEQNGDKIDYDFKHTKICDIWTLTISTPTISLSARQEFNPFTHGYQSWYTFDQYSPSGEVLSSERSCFNTFADKVFDKMLRTYISKAPLQKRIR